MVGTSATNDDGRPAVDVDRAAVRGLDVHKKTVMAALRTPGPDGARRQQVMEYSTYPRSTD